MLYQRIFLLSMVFLVFLNTRLLAETNNSFPNCDCPSVTGITVSSTNTSITVSWTGSSIYSSYLIQILKSGTVYFQTSTTASTVTIDGTSPSTSYSAKVFGVCGDYQAIPGNKNFTTVTAVATCGSGLDDIGGTDQNPIALSGPTATFIDQIESIEDIDAFVIRVPCPGVVTVALNSLSNDYDLGASAFDKKAGGIILTSTNPGTANEFISFTTPPNFEYPFEVRISIDGFNTAYNTYDCYTLTVTVPIPCFGGGPGGEGLKSKDPLELTMGEGNNTLLLNFDAGFEQDEDVSIQVFSTEGKLVVDETISLLRGENQHAIDLPRLDAGLYFVNASGSFGAITHKVVVAQ